MHRVGHCAALALLSALGIGAARAQVPITVIYQFDANSNTGVGPNGTLSFGIDGTLWGTTTGGPGFNGVGTVFDITTGGVLLHQIALNCSTTGCVPNGGLAMDDSGNLYGTTVTGPANAEGQPQSKIFRIGPNGTVNGVGVLNQTRVGGTTAGLTFQAGALYGVNDGVCEGVTCPSRLFQVNVATRALTVVPGPSDGLSADWRVSVDAQGNVWALSGDDAPDPNVIEILDEFSVTTRQWTHALQWNVSQLSGPCDAGPVGKPYIASNGTVYVTTTNATGNEGACGSGWLFKLPPGGPPVLVAQFDPALHGYPNGGVVADASGALYGLTAGVGGPGGGRAGGIVYCVTPSGSLVTLASLPAGTPNGDGVGELTPDGAGSFYGVTYDGGMFGEGAVFQITPGTACSS